MTDENVNMMKRKTEDLRVPKRPSKDEKYNYKENILDMISKSQNLDKGNW